VPERWCRPPALAQRGAPAGRGPGGGCRPAANPTPGVEHSRIECESPSRVNHAAPPPQRAECTLTLRGSYVCGSGNRVSSNARHRLSALCRYVEMRSAGAATEGWAAPLPPTSERSKSPQKLPSDAPALPLLRAKAATAARPDVALRWPGPPRSRRQRARGQSTRGQRTWPPPPQLDPDRTTVRGRGQWAGRTPEPAPDVSFPVC
jgi:hypothetical protein